MQEGDSLSCSGARKPYLLSLSGDRHLEQAWEIRDKDLGGGRRGSSENTPGTGCLAPVKQDRGWRPLWGARARGRRTEQGVDLLLKGHVGVGD